MSERQASCSAQPTTGSNGGEVRQHTPAFGRHRFVGGRRARRPNSHDMASQRGPLVPSIVHDVLASAGDPLDQATRFAMEPRFGRNFGDVRVHTDAGAAASARAVNAHAYTVGRDVVFGRAQYAPTTPQGRRVLAHELTHIVQQRELSATSHLTLGRPGGAEEQEAGRIARMLTLPGERSEPIKVRYTGLPAMLQRYEAGEHSQFGEAGAELKAAVAARTLTYKVKPGDRLEVIARRYGLDVKTLMEANADKVKKWRPMQADGKPGGGGLVKGFNAGEEVTIPPVLNEFTKEALKSRELVFTLNGVKLDYGEGIAMGDFYEDAAHMLAAPASELTALSALIKKEKAGTWVSTKEWNDATGGRYSKLAEKNEAHFAPSNPSLVAVSGAPHGSDNKTEWENAHKAGLAKSQAGLKDEALQVNSYGDHFLTDAFSAGHLINKRDVMERFKGGLRRNAMGEFMGDAKAFFDSVATTAFVGSVKTEFSKHKTVAAYNRHGKQDPSGWFHPEINDADRFSGLLQAIQDKEPDVLSSVAAKSVHDTLSTKPGGVPVQNARGDKWDLSGDKTLNTKSKEFGRKAVAQSQLNIFDVFKVTGTVDYPTKFKKVWDYVPVPTPVGEADVKSAVASGTDPKNAGLMTAVVALINAEYRLIISELVARKYLQ